MTFYVYCLLESSAGIPLLDSTEGIERQHPQQIVTGAFQAVVSRFSGDKLLPNKEGVYAHERVIDACMAFATPLPFRFGTAVSEASLQQFAATQEATLRADFDRVRGCVEMGVKVSWPEAARSATPEVPEVDENEGPGAQFLRQKQQKAATGKQTEAWINEAVAELLRESRCSRIGPNGSIVRIAHLVPQEHLEQYRERLKEHLRTRPGGAYLRSGPWPPYSFVSARM